MTITKDSVISVSINGIMSSAKVIKIGPWVKNKDIIAVNWISLDNAFKGVSDIRKCAEMEDPAAPTDPIMARWSIGKEKMGPMMREGHIFSSPLMLDGKKIGSIVDGGNGGTMYVIAPNTERNLFEKNCAQWSEVNGAEKSDTIAKFLGWWHDARPLGTDAKMYFASEKKELEKWLGKA